MKNTAEEIEKAKEILKNNGYYVDNLWRIEDVTDRYTDEDGNEISEDLANDLLHDTLTNQFTIEQIFYTMHDIAQADYNFEVK